MNLVLVLESAVRQDIEDEDEDEDEQESTGLMVRFMCRDGERGRAPSIGAQCLLHGDRSSEPVT